MLRKKKTPPISATGPGVINPGPPKPQSLRKAPAVPKAPVTPVAPKPAAPPAATGYPVTPASYASRTSADEEYGIAQGDAHQGLYRAALQYGDPAIQSLYGQYGPVVNNPNSDLSTIERTGAQQHVTTGNQMNRQNLYFSGTNQKAQAGIDTDISSRRAAAYQRFKDAEQRLMTAIANAKAKQQNVYRTTGAADIEASLAQAPQPAGVATGDVAPEKTISKKSIRKKK